MCRKIQEKSQSRSDRPAAPLFMSNRLAMLLLCREDAMCWSLCLLSLQELHERQFAHQRVCEVPGGDDCLCLHLPGCQSAAGKKADRRL